MNARDELFGIIYGVTDNPNWAVSEVHDAILDAGYRKPRTITTLDEAEALPDGAAILTKGQIIFRKYDNWFKEGATGWVRCTWGQNDPSTTEGLSYFADMHFPATVIFEPEAGA